MKIRKDHIVIEKINWSDKASNLRAISEELNIGLDSIIVFVDDFVAFMIFMKNFI